MPTLTSLILELLNKDSVKTALDKANKSEYFDEILSIDPTKDKNAVYSVKLTKFFLEKHHGSDEEHFNNIKYYFKKFLEFKNNKILKGNEADLNSIKNFDALHGLIDTTENKIRQSKPKKIEDIPDESSNKALGKIIYPSDVTYRDENIIVIRADNMQKSKHYGGGFSSWCTARKNNNLFYSYRFCEDGIETMYYVYFLKKQPSDMTQVLHFGVREDGSISYTDKSNNHNIELQYHDLEWLGKKFPEIIPALEANAFKTVPSTDKELKIKKLYNLTPEQFAQLDYEEKLMWFQMGDRNIRVDIWNLMDDELKNGYVTSFSGLSFDIDNEIFRKIIGTKYERVYFEAITERINDDDDDDDDEYTPHTPHEIICLGKTKNYNVIAGILGELQFDQIQTLIKYGCDREILNKIYAKNGKNMHIKFLLSSDKKKFIYAYLNSTKEFDGQLINVIFNYIGSQSIKDKIINKIISTSKNFTCLVAETLINNSSNEEDVIQKIIDSNKTIDTGTLATILQNTRLPIEYSIDKLIASNRQFDGDSIANLIHNSPTDQDKINTINKLITSNKQFSSHGIDLLINYSPTLQDKLNTIDKLIASNRQFDSKSIANLINYSPTPQDKLNTIDKLIASNRQFDSKSISNLIYYIPTPQDRLNTINKLIASNRQFDGDSITNLINYSPTLQDKINTINKLIASNIKFDSKSIFSSIHYSPTLQDKLNTINKLIASNRQFDSDSISILIYYSPTPQDKLNTIDKLIASNRQFNGDSISTLINYSPTDQDKINTKEKLRNRGHINISHNENITYQQYFKTLLTS